MKLTVETKVAAGIGASFVALTLGLAAQENSEEKARRFSHNDLTKGQEVTDTISTKTEDSFFWPQEPSRDKH
jgi:hypothetical protein